MFSGMPSINFWSLEAKADYLCLSAKYHESEYRKRVCLASLFVVKTFILYISLELTELLRCTVQYNLVGGKQEECKIKFSFPSGIYFVQIYFYVLLPGQKKKIKLCI